MGVRYRENRSLKFIDLLPRDRPIGDPQKAYEIIETYTHFILLINYLVIARDQ